MTEKILNRRFAFGCIFVVLGFVWIMISLIFPFHFFLNAWTHFENTITIDPYGRLKIDQNYFMGGIIRGQVIVSNESNGTIVFYIEDSSGKTIVGPREINNSIKFEFQPQETSFYTIVLDNMGGDSRSIFIITWQYYYNILLTILSLVLFIIGIILIITSSEKITLKTS
jgi:hypothetical protein